MPFYNHLRSHQNIRLLIGKGRQNFLIAIFVAGRIKIHTQYPCLWKTFLDDFLNFLRSRLKSSDIR